MNGSMVRSSRSLYSLASAVTSRRWPCKGGSGDVILHPTELVLLEQTDMPEGTAATQRRTFAMSFLGSAYIFQVGSSMMFCNVLFLLY